jgi:hypothetical protein
LECAHGIKGAIDVLDTADTPAHVREKIHAELDDDCKGTMEASNSPTKKMLILECAHGVKGAIDALDTDTPAHVREKTHAELDDDCKGMMEASTSPTKKRLILECAHGVKGVIDALETDTLEHVREKIHEELDDDMIPSPDFSFHVDDIRISLKQEKKNRAWDVLSHNVRLQVKRQISSLDGFNNGTEFLENGSEPPPVKRIRTETLGLKYNSPRAVSGAWRMKGGYTPGLVRRDEGTPRLVGWNTNTYSEKKSLNNESNELTSRDNSFYSVAKNTAKNSGECTYSSVDCLNGSAKDLMDHDRNESFEYENDTEDKYIHDVNERQGNSINWSDGIEDFNPTSCVEDEDFEGQKNTIVGKSFSVHGNKQECYTEYAVKKTGVCMKEGCETIIDTRRGTKTCPVHKAICVRQSCANLRSHQKGALGYCDIHLLDSINNTKRNSSMTMRRYKHEKKAPKKAIRSRILRPRVKLGRDRKGLSQRKTKCATSRGDYSSQYCRRREMIPMKPEVVEGICTNAGEDISIDQHFHSGAKMRRVCMKEGCEILIELSKPWAIRCPAHVRQCLSKNCQTSSKHGCEHYCQTCFQPKRGFKEKSYQYANGINMSLPSVTKKPVCIKDGCTTITTSVGKRCHAHSDQCISKSCTKFSRGRSNGGFCVNHGKARYCYSQTTNLLKEESHDNSKETALTNTNAREYCSLTTAGQMKRSHSVLKKTRVCWKEGCDKVVIQFNPVTKLCRDHTGLCRWKDCSVSRRGHCDGYCKRHCDLSKKKAAQSIKSDVNDDVCIAVGKIAPTKRRVCMKEGCRKLIELTKPHAKRCPTHVNQCLSKECSKGSATHTGGYCVRHGHERDRSFQNKVKKRKNKSVKLSVRKNVLVEKNVQHPKELRVERKKRVMLVKEDDAGREPLSSSEIGTIEGSNGLEGE